MKMKMTTQNPHTNENEVERANPWLPEALKHNPELRDAVAKLNDRLIHGGGTKTPPEGAESICWYADEQFDDAFYRVNDAAHELGADFEYDDHARICCGEPVALCPACTRKDSFCHRHNGGNGTCATCGTPLVAPIEG
jgi:hypothetical protein